MGDNMSVTGASTDDSLVIGGNDITIDLGSYGAAQSTYTIGNIDTITLDPSVYVAGSSDTLTWTTSDYTLNNWSSNYSNASVNIDTNGVKIKEDGDLKIGDRSLKDFMDRVEDRLAILHPNEALEDKWEQLKDLRRQYEALEKDILEKEKIMKILKEQ